MAGGGDACVARVLDTTRQVTAQIGIDPAMVEIQPEPSPAERAAILLALEHMLDATPNEEPPTRSAWATAGRHESHPGSIGGPGSGWGRVSSRLAGW